MSKAIASSSKATGLPSPLIPTLNPSNVDLIALCWTVSNQSAEKDELASGKNDEIGKKENLARSTGTGSVKSDSTKVLFCRMTARFENICFIPKTKLNFITKEI